MSFHEAVLVKVDDLIRRWLACQGITATVLTHVEHCDDRGADAGETRARKQDPEPGLVGRSVLLREEIARGDAHGRTERLKETGGDALFDVAAAVARDVPDRKSHAGQDAADGEERGAVADVVVSCRDENQHQVSCGCDDGVDDENAGTGFVAVG